MRTAFPAIAALALTGAAPQHHDHSAPRAAQAQLDELRAAIERYRDFGVAERAGWKKFGGDEPLMGEHWYLPEEKGGIDYVAGDAIDFARPSNLMYTDIGGRKVLTGVAFVVRLGPGEPLPEGFAGSADKWHVHDFERAIDAATETRPLLRWIANAWLNDRYRNRGDDRGRLAMAHAWVTLPNPDGMFADHNRTVPYLKLGLPAAYAHGASEDTARGLHLATANGCGDTLDGRLWIADAGRKAKRALKAGCADAAARVKAALGGDAAALNRTAETAWREFDRQYRAALTPEQRARVDAMTEHGAGQDEHAH